MVMIKKIIQEYEKQKAEFVREQQKMKEENSRLAKALTDRYMQEANRDVATIHENQKRIAKEIKKLQVTAQNFVVQTQQWKSLHNDLTRAFKEAGEIANWFQVLERRTQAVKEHLRAPPKESSDTQSRPHYPIPSTNPRTQAQVQDVASQQSDECGEPVIVDVSAETKVPLNSTQAT